MFRTWNEALKAYSKNTIRYTYIKNWESHEGIKKFIELINASTLDTVIHHGDNIIEIQSAKLDMSLIDQSVKERFLNFAMDYGIMVTGWTLDQYRYIENLNAPELDLHLEFNEGRKSVNKNGAQVTIFSGSGSDDHEPLERIRERVKTEEVEYTLTGSALEKLEEWSGRKYHWFKEDGRLYILNSRIMSIIYDANRVGLLDKPDLILEHPALIFRNDYSVGGGKRVMNWETVNSKTNLWNVADWDDFGLAWEDVKYVTGGKPYPGIICKFSEENEKNRRFHLTNFLR